MTSYALNDIDLFSEKLSLRTVNVASVPQRSPFRYPGGKTWLIPQIRKWLSSLPQKPKLFIEPFVGGAIVSLTAAMENLVEKVLMVELDDEVAAVWKTIINGDAEWLATRIENFGMSLDAARKIVAASPTETKEIAFRTIVKNRTMHGGILAAGTSFLNQGENGKGVLSRWYPSTLAKRIRTIDFAKQKIEFIHGSAFDAIKQHQKCKTAVWFVDPPYTVGGKKAGSRLYTHSEVDHEKIFSLMEHVAGDFLLTYDDSVEVKMLAQKHGFNTRLIPMKGTHNAEMTELLIGRDLSWFC